MDSALASFKRDIDAGFRILHIDTSATPNGEAPITLALERLVKLYSEVVAYARKTAKRVEFEIGFEEQRAELCDLAAFESSVVFIMDAFAKLGLPKPRYFVAQTGTKVIETENRGPITNPRFHRAVKKNLQGVVSICNRYGVSLKAHNCDYLNAEDWQILVEAGVKAVNIAPEYGVFQMQTFLDLLKQEGLLAERDRFLQIAYDSGKWRKWMANPTLADDYKRALLAGYYVFSTPEILALRRMIGKRLFGKPKALDAYLKRAVKTVILRHLSWFVQYPKN